MRARSAARGVALIAGASSAVALSQALERVFADRLCDTRAAGRP